MDITDAQRDVRTTFVGGFAGQLVSSAIWFASAALATWHSQRSAIYALVFGGMLIFPATLLLLRSMGRPGGLPKGHPMNALGMQVAFIVPASLPVVAGATLYRHNWFYPACMIIVGAHYFPFIFMYGMWQFGISPPRSSAQAWPSRSICLPHSSSAAGSPPSPFSSSPS